MSFRPVTKRRPCPVCRKPDWCGLSSDGNVVICMRVESEHKTRNGGYLHVLSIMPNTPRISKNLNKNHAEVSSCRSGIEHLNGVYAALLRSHLVLSENHRAALRARGLSDQAIERNGYRSVPDHVFAANVARALTQYGLEGVPGFYFDNGWKMLVRAPGFYIPVRDSHSRIQALQVRQDDNLPRYLWLSSSYKPKGASSGAPVHFQNAHLIRQTGRAIVTEGALKADVIAHLQNTGAIGIAGVSTFPEDFGAKLREDIPELRETIIAFDSDWHTKPQVKQALFKLISSLEKARLSVRVRTWWNGAKGYDDYLQGVA